MDHFRKYQLNLLAAALLLPSMWGCAVGKLIPVNLNVTSERKGADGKVDRRQMHWQGTVADLPDGLNKAANELQDVTDELVRVLTEVPPPGTVALGDLGPGLSRFQGSGETDFLIAAKDKEGKPISFQYVRLGIPTYDDFFKQAQLVYALTYQASHTARRLGTLAGKILSTEIDASAELGGAAKEALRLEGRANVDASLVGKLRITYDLGSQVAPLVVSFPTQIVKLIMTGQSLIANAPTTITNPKVLVHLDLVKKGLFDSITVIKDSGEQIVALASVLKGLASTETAPSAAFTVDLEQLATNDLGGAELKVLEAQLVVPERP